MSHFTVLVVTETADQLEAALAPFQENNMGDCPEEFLRFFSTQEEVEEGYKDVDKNEYPTLAAYAEDYYGYEVDKETGEYGYWENPNKKWDWWVLGGRWSGKLLLKPGAEGEIGDSGFFGPEAKPGYVDQAKKKDIDFDGMMEGAAIDAREQFAKVMKALKGITEKPKTWSQIRSESETIEKAREVYHSQPAIVALREAKLRSYANCEIEHYHLHEDDSEDKYVNDCRCKAVQTFAVLIDGKWYERGEMGWFGVVSDEKLRYDWSAQFTDIIDSISEDAILSIVDCHI